MPSASRSMPNCAISFPFRSFNVPLVRMYALAGKLVQHVAQQVRQRNPRQSAPSGPAPPAAAGAVRIQPRAACSSRRRTQAGVCGLRSSALPPPSAPPSIRFEIIRDSIGTPSSMPIFCRSVDPLPRENAHQVVFKRQIKPRCARIALASRAPAKLVVDAPRLVPLRADNVQSAGRHDRFVILGRVRRVSACRPRSHSACVVSNSCPW